MYTNPMEPLPLTDALRLAMKAKGLTQASLAAKIGVSQPVVGRLLTGSRPSLTGSLERVLEALGVEMLVTLRQKPAPPPEALEAQQWQADSLAELARDLARIETDPVAHRVWLAAFAAKVEPFDPASFK
jgi:transcriptional regulator with XRE-family HTH domain